MILMEIDALQPMERQIADLVHDRDVMTTSEVYEAITSAGRQTTRASVRTCLANLARMGVVSRIAPTDGNSIQQQTRWRAPV